MKNLFKKVLLKVKSFIPNQYLDVISDLLIPNVFGQLGEDAVIHNHIDWVGLSANDVGSYIDIGCFHPTRGSNTFKFYRKGSSGLVIDIGKKKKKLWSLVRPRDLFINAAVVPLCFKDERISFKQQQGYGAGTDHVLNEGVTDIDDKVCIEVDVINPKQITDLCLKNTDWLSASWRLINIDIEGMDEKVLLDFDLGLLKPDVIAIESFLPKSEIYLDKIKYHSKSNLTENLAQKGYTLQSICGPTLIFTRIT